MPIYKNIDFDDSLTPVVRHLSAVHEYRESLQSLQTSWDNLTLLGQLSGNRTDMSATREAFSALTSDLLNHLGIEVLSKAVQTLRSKAQVAIDIMVRNLFERTADIGFLATDDDIVNFAARAQQAISSGEEKEQYSIERRQLEARFSEYVQKYSVYHDVILIGADGHVLARLGADSGPAFSTDPLVREALSTRSGYVEVFRATDLFPGKPASLLYAYRVSDRRGEPLAALVLCFNLENEARRIFGNLVHDRDWTVLSLLDEEGRVVVSSDAIHLPLGAHLERVLDKDWGVVRFAGREYLAITRPAQAYQGYGGPGWTGHAMIALDHAFDGQDSGQLNAMPPGHVAALMKSPTLFSEDLRNIPLQAGQIQQELNRLIWNGSLHHRDDMGSMKSTGDAFSKVLLAEIGNTGLRTTDIFTRSIANLNETVMSSILDDCAFFASLAIDIMDRNLYERANDCRWWALTGAFTTELTSTNRSSETIQAVLESINSLYTVYENIVVFDAHGVVVAVSNPRYESHVGRHLDQEWVRRCLSLGRSKEYVVSDFETTPLYLDRHTYIYAAAIPGGERKPSAGGIAVVFDAVSQFKAMLEDALPRGSNGDVRPGSLAIFADRNQRVISSTSDRFGVGTGLPFSETLFRLPCGCRGKEIILIDGHYFAVGASASSGYREFKSEVDAYRNDVIALVLAPLGQAVATDHDAFTNAERVPLRRQKKGLQDIGCIEMATFHVGKARFALPSSDVLEAIDIKGIARLPGFPAHIHGTLIYDDEPIMILDLQALLVPDAEQSLPSSSYRQVVVIQDRANASKPFGLLVHQLGEVVEIQEDHINPIKHFFFEGSGISESVIRAETVSGSMETFISLSSSNIHRKLVGDNISPLRLLCEKSMK